MYRVLNFITLAVLVLPGALFAHASPVESFPISGAQLQTPPKELSIRFSERLEQGSSRIKVADTAGVSVVGGEAQVASDNRYVLTVPLMPLGEGVYVASWSVVSSDDGHFTKGSFAFSIGSATAPVSATDSVVVQLTGYKEATAMFIEFVGNSILWGVLLMLIVIVRPLLRNEKYSEYLSLIKRVFSYLVYVAVFVGISGGVMQIILKTGELAGLHESSFREALSMYLVTTSGSSTLYRMAALGTLAIIFTLFRRSMFVSARISIGELLFAACLLEFAYFRAIVSHATANPFHPKISVVANVLHLIEKDLWPGLLTCLIALVIVFGSRTEFARSLIARTFALLTVNLAALSLTASYIIWLHLKDFSNVSSTLWGENFLRLLAPALVLVCIHAYHVIALRFRPRLFSRFFPCSVSAEATAAFLVVYFSSLVIITSPPLHHAEPKEFATHDQGVTIELQKSPYEDTQMLLTTDAAGEPVVLIGEGEGGLQAALSKRFEGGYVFPSALVENKNTNIHIIVPQENGYDARASFAIAENDLRVPEGHGRTVDFFTVGMIFIALAAFGFALYLRYIVINSMSELPASLSFFGVLVGLTVVLVISGMFTNAALALFGNNFKRQCIADGNMWHLMLPMKAGVPVSSTPEEGCMMMSGLYHIADKREYDYLRALPPAEVTLSALPEIPTAGIPARMSLIFTEEDGSPGKLSIIHEKLVHMIIVSADMSEFAHVHPEDIVTVGDDISNSRFEITHTFPKAGEYLVAVDYLHGLTPESKQFRLVVDGTPSQENAAGTFASPAHAKGFDVSFEYKLPFSGEVTTLQYTVRKEAVPVVDLEPYLAAAMHVAVVKNDLSEFIHTHGEVHSPGYVPPKTLTHNHALPPARFGPIVEAHVAFPEPGLYTVFGEFKHANLVVPTKFTVQVE